jgi:hypothetical protein
MKLIEILVESHFNGSMTSPDCIVLDVSAFRRVYPFLAGETAS